LGGHLREFPLDSIRSWKEITGDLLWNLRAHPKRTPKRAQERARVTHVNVIPGRQSIVRTTTTSKREQRPSFIMLRIASEARRCCSHTVRKPMSRGLGVSSVLQGRCSRMKPAPSTPSGAQVWRRGSQQRAAQPRSRRL